VPGPALVALDLAGPPERWVAFGLSVADEVAQLGDVTLRFGGEGKGLIAWSLRGTGAASLDGIATEWLPNPVVPSAPSEHPLGAVAIDHVVVATPDPPRTFAAFEAAGLVLRREAAAGSAEHPVIQGFFRHGEAIVEVVGPRAPDGTGPARLWGLTLVVADLDAACTRLGDHATPPKDAVQPGRRIASVRRSAGLPVPVALMTPAG
jgi:hypothetical protein